MFSLKVKINEVKIRLLNIEKEILGGNMPILEPMYGKIGKSSFTMEIGEPVNTLGFKKSSTFQIKPKFVWSMLYAYKTHNSACQNCSQFYAIKAFFIPVSNYPYPFRS